MTYEKSRASWNNGFRGYKDNSPEAKQRRQDEESVRIFARNWTALQHGTLTVPKGSTIFDVLLGNSKFCKRLK